MKNSRRVQNLILPIISILSLIAIWGVTARVMGKEYILPTVELTFSSMLKLFGELRFYRALLFTVLRSLIAFSVSFILAFIFAYFSKKSQVFKKVISPFISIMRALPTIAIIPIIIVWTNANTYVTPVVVTMMVVLPTVYVSVYNSIDVVDDNLIETCKLFGLSEREILKKVQIPQILPPMLLTIGTGISLNLKLMVAAEVLSATSRSIGALLNNASQLAEVSQMLAIVVVAVALSLIIEGVFSLLSKKVGKWK